MMQAGVRAWTEVTTRDPICCFKIKSPFMFVGLSIKLNAIQLKEMGKVCSSVKKEKTDIDSILIEIFLIGLLE